MRNYYYLANFSIVWRKMNRLGLFLCILGLTFIGIGLWIKSETYQMRYEECLRDVKMYKNYVER